MRLLIIDNHDSFTYNLLQILREAGLKDYVLKFPEQIGDAEDVNDFDKLLISPGPGLPSGRPVLAKAILKARCSVLGVCLGHQAIAEAFGGRLRHVGRVVHGEADTIIHSGDSIMFKGVSPKFQAGKYHSWCVDEHSLPEKIRATAHDRTGMIMALEHIDLPLYGIQFHPESIMSPQGEKIIKNWLFDH